MLKVGSKRFILPRVQSLVRSENIDRIVKSAELSCAKKGSRYFVGYKTNKEVIPLCFVPKIRMCLKNFNDAKTFCFLALWIIPLALVC